LKEGGFRATMDGFLVIDFMDKLKTMAFVFGFYVL
jgi:hypothetical protein